MLNTADYVTLERRRKIRDLEKDLESSALTTEDKEASEAKEKWKILERLKAEDKEIKRISQKLATEDVFCSGWELFEHAQEQDSLVLHPDSGEGLWVVEPFMSSLFLVPPVAVKGRESRLEEIEKELDTLDPFSSSSEETEEEEEKRGELEEEKSFLHSTNGFFADWQVSRVFIVSNFLAARVADQGFLVYEAYGLNLMIDYDFQGIDESIVIHMVAEHLMDLTAPGGGISTSFI